MDRNSMIGFILIGLIMFGFMGYQSKQYRKQLDAQAQIDSIARIEAARQDSIRQAYLLEHPEELDCPIGEELSEGAKASL